MKFLFLSSILLVLTVIHVASVQEVWACSCYPVTPQEQFDYSDHVFIGTVTNTEYTNYRVNGSPGDGELATFEVEKLYKGNLTSTVIVETSTETSCAYSFGNGGRYVVFANVRDSGYSSTIGYCSGTHGVPESYTLDYPEIEISPGVTPTCHVFYTCGLNQLGSILTAFPDTVSTVALLVVLLTFTLLGIFLIAVLIILVLRKRKLNSRKDDNSAENN